MVEDVDSNAEWQTQGLQCLGCNVIRATNGAVAIDLAAKAQFDLILMDCRMPVMDGSTATRAIRALESATQRRRTPIVAITAGLMPEEKRRYHEAGMDDVLAKPFSLEELDRVLKRYVR
jgi:CheY-like chemotaxis protein